MELHDEQALEPAGPPVDPALMRPAGLLAKLVSAVRPEFRVDVFVVDSADPVFGGCPCRVAGCGRAARSHDLCEGHSHRWRQRGRPDVAEFASSDPRDDAQRGAAAAVFGSRLRLWKDQQRAVSAAPPGLAGIRGA